MQFSSPTLTNVTITGNTAEYFEGGGMHLLDSSNPTLINSIISNNNPESIDLSGDEEPIITYSNIEGGWEGEGNIDANPLFINSEEGNFLLQTIELGYNNNSPCKGTGENGTDMGAFSNVIP